MTATELPGGDLVAAGLDDLQRGRESVAALLVSIGGPRLRRLRYAVPDVYDEPERRLHALLARKDPDSVHGRYNGSDPGIQVPSRRSDVVSRSVY